MSYELKLGTVIILPDGRQATVVYHGLDGYGIKWGRHEAPACVKLKSDAMLREDYPGAEFECVGKKWTIVHLPLSLEDRLEEIDNLRHAAGIAMIALDLEPENRPPQWSKQEAFDLLESALDENFCSICRQGYVERNNARIEKRRSLTPITPDCCDCSD